MLRGGRYDQLSERSDGLRGAGVIPHGGYWRGQEACIKSLQVLQMPNIFTIKKLLQNMGQFLLLYERSAY